MQPKIKSEILTYEKTRKAADAGDATAQFNLGIIYANGYGVTQEYDQAAYWFRKAAEKGDDAAQFNLGVMYASGQGVPQNYAEAVSWYHKAARQGNTNAHVNLGVMYAIGQGVAQNYDQAAYWFSSAAENGDDDAKYILGQMAASGQGMPQDFGNAAYWLGKITKQSDDNTQNNIGVTFSDGKIVQQNDAKTTTSVRIATEKRNSTAEVKKKKWFSKIESRDEAIEVVKEASLAFFVIATLEAAFAIFFRISFLFDSAIFAIGGLFLRKYNSRAVSIGLLTVSMIDTGVTFANAGGANLGGGKNWVVALLIVFASVRAVDATFKLHGRFSKERHISKTNTYNTKQQDSTKNWGAYTVIIMALILAAAFYVYRDNQSVTRSVVNASSVYQPPQNTAPAQPNPYGDLLPDAVINSKLRDSTIKINFNSAQIQGLVKNKTNDWTIKK